MAKGWTMWEIPGHSIREYIKIERKKGKEKRKKINEYKASTKEDELLAFKSILKRKHQNK